MSDCVWVIRIIQLVLCRGIFAVFFLTSVQNLFVNTLCGHSVEFCSVKTVGTESNHKALNC